MKLITIMLLGVASLVALAGCSMHDIRVQIEGQDGHVRYYQTYMEDGPNSEIWTCKQEKVGKLSATYQCEARLWQ